jgi:L,D-transpeptidase YcbB
MPKMKSAKDCPPDWSRGTGAAGRGLPRMSGSRRFLSFFRSALMAAGLMAAASFPAHAQGVGPAMLQTALVAQASDELKPFYFHSAQPLWVNSDGTLRLAADQLLTLIRTAHYDGLDPQALGQAEIEAAMADARANPTEAALVRVELALTNGFVDYVEGMSPQSSSSAMMYEHDVLRPLQPDASAVLLSAAEAPSLEEYLGQLRWMHPLYAQIRQGLTAAPPTPSLENAAIASLQRVRSIPAPPWSRHVVVDIPSARLFMYEGGQVVDSMKLVVGKIEYQTPQMAGYLRYAVLNPYWNVPEHLIRQTIAPNVIRQGVGYLRRGEYEVLANDWGPNPEVLNPATLDWQAIKNGTLLVRVRQKPRDDNSMGDVKFEFPNPEGIFLHDTPHPEYMLRAVRQLSNGCIRLEDAVRFGNWLFGAPMPAAQGANPEQRLDLPEPVPIYITYLTVQPNGGQLAIGTDPYRFDVAPSSILARVQ